jgi:hypothetical protein
MYFPPSGHLVNEWRAVSIVMPTSPFSPWVPEAARLSQYRIAAAAISPKLRPPKLRR